MISSSSLSAFSSAQGIGTQGIGGTSAPARPQRPPAGVQQAAAQPARAQPLQPGQALQALPGGQAPAPGQNLPRGSLLDLSV